MRYKFIRDDDCHWFLIPVELEPLFVQLLENGEADWWAEFSNKFEEYCCDSPCNYTFTDPQ